jgi:hypothetical protein
MLHFDLEDICVPLHRNPANAHDVPVVTKPDRLRPYTLLLSCVPHMLSHHAAATFVHQPLDARLTSGCATLTQDAAGLRTIRELQRGASGVIVLAEESSGSTSTPVAVKLLPRVKAASPALQREMLTQRSCLMHPHVIQVWLCCP